MWQVMPYFQAPDCQDESKKQQVSETDASRQERLPAETAKSGSTVPGQEHSLDRAAQAAIAQFQPFLKELSFLPNGHRLLNGVT